jgi:glutamate-1-semialdehyde 2,1-aminomutase
MASGVNAQTLARAYRLLPGGVNSPARSFQAVGVPPLVAHRGEGAYLYDRYGNRHLDFLMSWGAVMLGHAHSDVTRAIARAAARGTSFGLTNERELELAERIVRAVPSVEMVRLVNSGTEAVMSAVRLARGFTGRGYVIVFEGGYHGHSDGLLARAGSGLATFSIPQSAGVPHALVNRTLIVRYNDLGSVERIFNARGREIAAILVEPVAGNMGVVPPGRGFLESLRAIADEHGALLVFDEVITGFRVAPGGAQQRYGVRPDLTTLGKVIGGGLPVGAFGGRREIMEHLAPLGDVYQAGTLSGNPVVAAAGSAVLEALETEPPYDRLDRLAERLCTGVAEAAATAGVALQVGRLGPMFTFFFAESPVVDYAGARASDMALYGAFFRGMLAEGVLLPPSQFETGFISACHTEQHVEQAIAAARQALEQVARIDASAHVGSSDALHKTG